MGSVLKREKKEQDQKATIEPSDEIGRKMRRERDRCKCLHFVALSSHRKPGVLGWSRYALAHPGLLPPLPTLQPARRCRRAAEGKTERGSGFAGWLKRYNSSHKSQGFPGEEGYAAAFTYRLPLLFSWKGTLYSGQGIQSLNPATTSLQKYYGLPQEGQMEMVLRSRHKSVVNWTKNELAVRKRQKAVEERG